MTYVADQHSSSGATGSDGGGRQTRARWEDQARKGRVMDSCSNKSSMSIGRLCMLPQLRWRASNVHHFWILILLDPLLEVVLYVTSSHIRVFPDK